MTAAARSTRSARRTGYVLVYSITLMVTLLAVASVAVDWGHVQLAKTQLMGATDAAARAGAAGLATSPAEAYAAAKRAALANVVDGTPLTLSDSDIALGTWDPSAKTFTVLAGTSQYQANAVRVTAARSSANGPAVPLSFAAVFGRRSADVRAEATVMYVRPVSVDQPVAGVSNPFLAGMPKGSKASLNNPHNSPDVAGDAVDPKQSPQTVTMPIAEGLKLSFDSIAGVVRHDPSLADYNPDGQLDSIGHNNTTGSDYNSTTQTFYNENGIADVRAPINALVGVFLSDDAPNLTAAPKNLDFSTPESRDFQELKPELKQIFFIGDGLDASGRPQTFVAPKGATRLYLATWDFYEWNNNSGSRTVKVYRPEQIITVK
ncbi:MAG TPA: TadG family pilus assembly protein [Humisphaera sp.]